MRKTVKGRISSPTDATYWLNLYWDQLHVGLMCAPAQHWSKKAADTEHHINRLMFGDIRRIGNRAHKVIFREKEECADV
jgi:hypothetical protein